MFAGCAFHNPGNLGLTTIKINKKGRQEWTDIMKYMPTSSLVTIAPRYRQLGQGTPQPEKLNRY